MEGLNNGVMSILLKFDKRVEGWPAVNKYQTSELYCANIL